MTFANDRGFTIMMKVKKDEFLKSHCGYDGKNGRVGHGEGLFLKRSVPAGTVRHPICNF